MAITLSPEGVIKDIPVIDSGDIDPYTYPKGLDFTPNSELHGSVLKKILQYTMDASTEITNRHEEWRSIDATLTAYVSPTVKNQAREKGDKTRPIIIPSSYAILETLLAYMVATFLQDPVFKYDPTGPEDAKGAALLEIIVQTQVIKAKVGLALHTQWRDAFAYGLGVTSPSWKIVKGHRRVAKTITEEGTDLDQVEVVREKATLYEGNVLNNIDPFLYLPDPLVAAQDIQDARFVGWVSRDSKLSLLDDEFTKDSDLFNVRYLRLIPGNSQFMVKDRFKPDTATNSAQNTAYMNSMDSMTDLVTMYITLVPSDWDLGKSDKPEKWRFIVAGDTIIISAQPLNLDHNMYPVSVAAPDYDGYSATPTSRIEMSLGMQEIVDFLFNSHISNVRKAVNDTLVVDPSMINMNDLRSPEPGKIIRTRRASWGRGVAGAVEQLKVVDITKNNLGDIAMLLNQMKETTAAVDVISGNVRAGGERRSATEFRDARTGALAKLNKTATIIAMQSMQDIGFIFGSQTQQLMSDEMKVALTGRWAEDLAKEYDGASAATVSITDILVATDVTVGSGNIPGGEPTELWIQLLQSVSGNPEVMAQLDMPRIFMHIARQLGATNTADFMKDVQIVPDQQVQQGVETGNLVPVS